VTAAVVPTVAVNGAGVPFATLTELGTVHVGAGVTTGVMLQLRLTVPLKVPAGVTCMSNFALCPALMVCDVDCPNAGPTAKSGAACTTCESVVLWTMEPDVPETFTGYVPAGVVVDVVTVNADVPEALLMVAGLKPQLAPLGKPEQESVTVPLNPKVGATATVEVAAFPATTVEGDKGLAESSKPDEVVLNSTPTPGNPNWAPQGKTMSGRPSPFMSATMAVGRLPYRKLGAPKVPSPFPNKIALRLYW